MSIRGTIKNRLQRWFGGQGYLKAGAKYTHKWYGEPHAGFFLHTDTVNENSIVYSLGIGEDISFDKEVIRQFSCNIYGFDPTPKTIEWLKKNPPPGRFHFVPAGIAANAGEMDFFLPKNPDFVSGSAFLHNNVSEGVKITVPMITISDAMSRFGHDRIDVLKMDIEGAEYEVIDSILTAGIPIGQILVEFHSRFFENGNEKTKAAVTALRNHGYEIFAVSELLQEVSFIQNNPRPK